MITPCPYKEDWRVDTDNRCVLSAQHPSPLAITFTAVCGVGPAQFALSAAKGSDVTRSIEYRADDMFFVGSCTATDTPFVSLCLCLFVCLPVCFCLFVCLSACLPTCLPVCLSVSVCLSVCLSLSVYVSVCQSFSLSVCLSVSVFLSVCLSLPLPE